MTNPTDAEIEAAAQAIGAIEDEDHPCPWDTFTPFWQEYYRRCARAALTAAAQARAQALQQISDNIVEKVETRPEYPETAARVRERADMEALQRAAEHDRPMICRWCNKMHRGGPENCGNPDATYTKAQSGGPALMPIYDSTEDPGSAT